MSVVSAGTQGIARAGWGRWRLPVGRTFLLSYVALYGLVLLAFDESTLISGVLFVTANLAISALFVLCFKFSTSYWPLHLLMYSVYFVVYIVKGIVQYAVELNSDYTVMTIRIVVTTDDYVRTLGLVSAGHLILTLLLISFGLVANRKPSVPRKSYPSNRLINWLLIASLGWAAVTSVVMYHFGVAVMGAEGVQLPFRLSGVFFYSRTIVLPMLLVYFLQKALVHGDDRLLKQSVLLLLALSLSEVVVRAAKSPLFVMVLQIVFLYLVLLSRDERIVAKIKKTYVVLMFVLAVALWPIVEGYRTMKVFGGETLEVTANVAEYVENKNYALYAVERLFQRLIGFTQFSGLVADTAFEGRLDQVIEHGGLAGYYTRHYLGYTREGHLSSPSLLGASLILGGSYWPAVFSAYVLLMTLIWRLVFLLPRLAVVTTTFIAVEVFNTFMAGTMDSSLGRIVIVLAVAWVLEGMLARSRRRSRVPSLGTA